MRDPRRQTWSRGGLGGKRRWPCSTSRSIGQATPPSAFQDQVGAGFVIEAELHPMAVAEVELGQIPMQMSFRNVMVNAVDAALENGEVSLDGVGVDISAHVFFLLVFDGPMLVEIPADTDVNLMLVGHETAIGVSVFSDDWMQICGSHVGNVESANLPAALNKRQDGLLWRRDLGVSPVSLLAAYVGFVALHDAPLTAKRFVTDRLHGFSDPHGHEPSGFQGDAHGPMDLVRADALLAGRDEVDGLKPDMQGHMAGLRTRSRPSQ